MIALYVHTAHTPFLAPALVIGALGFVLYRAFARYPRTRRATAGVCMALVGALAVLPHVLCCFATCELFVKYSVEWWLAGCWAWGMVMRDNFDRLPFMPELTADAELDTDERRSMAMFAKVGVTLIAAAALILSAVIWGATRGLLR